MRHPCAGPLARTQQNTGDAIGAAIASDFGKAVAAMTHALSQIALRTVEQHPALGILTVLALIFLVLSPWLLRWSAELREWFGDRGRRRLQDRLHDEENIVRALEIDAQREQQQERRRRRRKGAPTENDAGPPKPPP